MAIQTQKLFAFNHFIHQDHPLREDGGLSRKFFLENTPYEIYYEMTALFIGLLGLAVRV
ncbi:hypothetical protein ACF3NR_05845 [Vaginella massiliensis]|uniref:hypothetical protein n=1 Tax=Vaginella massiliensis TaxID=1816680 RepID=UPI001F41D3F2|nr:hypothetical protein [Vaginella massiliensis]